MNSSVGEKVSFKKNYIASLLQNFLSLIFPIITFPYVSRVLGPESIGKVEYVLSITYYFTLFMHLGIPLYGAREVAKVKKNEQELAKLVSEITSIYLLSSLLSTVLYYIVLFFFFRDYKDISLFLIAGLNIVLTSISFNWFIQGVEKHSYLSMSRIISKIINLIFLFLFINSKDDYMYYLLLSVITNLFLAVIGVRVVSRQVNISFKDVSIAKHIKGIIGVSGISITDGSFIKVSTLMLGAMSSNTSVGLFAASFRFLRICEGMITVISKIAMPRISSLLAAEDKEKRKEQQLLIFNAIWALSLPASIGLFFVSEEIIIVFAGSQFKDSIVVLKYLSSSIVSLSISTYLFNQFLFPLGYVKWSVFVGFLTTVSIVIATYLLIPLLDHVGAAIAFSLVAAINMLLNAYKVKCVSEINLINKDFFVVILASLVMYSGLYFLDFKWGDMTNLFLKTTIGGIIYGTTLLLAKHSLINYSLKR